MIGTVAPDWPAPSCVRAFSTTRQGGVSVGPWSSLNLGETTGDDPGALIENRRRFSERLPAPPGWLRQVHGKGVLRRDDWQSPDDTADAAWTASPGLPCTILTADCLPVLLCAPDGSAVAAAHAGWRGLVGGVLPATICSMDVDPGSLLAWIGPGIGMRAYEVGEAFRDSFREALPWLRTGFHEVEGRVHADLAAIARAILEREGVVHVHGGDFCTYTEADRFFSHRREPGGGRMATTIWIESDSAASAERPL